MIEYKYDDGLLICGDNLQWSKSAEDNSVDLIFGSPPYEAQRTYGIGFNITGQDWVDWMICRWKEWDRISKGLVAMVVEGFTEDFQWSASPALLMADLHRAGFKLRKPPLYVRHGMPGTGGPDWFSNGYEFVICTTKGKLPWSDNTACGHPPKYETGGAMSNRHKDGSRSKENKRSNVMPELANPGNLIDCGAVGGGNIGSDLAHEGEAPFPEKLADFFIRSCCPKGGIVLDPFIGSGTTASVARQNRRRFIGIDIRESQIEITRKRLQQATMRQGFDL